MNHRTLRSMMTTLTLGLALLAGAAHAELPPIFKGKSITATWFDGNRMAQREVFVMCRTSVGNYATFWARTDPRGMSIDNLTVYRPGGQILLSRQRLRVANTWCIDLDTASNGTRGTWDLWLQIPSFRHPLLQTQNGARLFVDTSISRSTAGPTRPTTPPQGNGNGNGTPAAPARKTGQARLVVYNASGASTGSTLLRTSPSGVVTSKAWAVQDLNGNRQVDGEPGDARYAYPRVPQPQGGAWRLVEGKGYLPGANVIVIAALSTWSSVNRPQFVALHLKVANGVVTPIGMFAGDLQTSAASPAGPTRGVVMFSDRVKISQISGSAASPGKTGQLRGVAEGFLTFIDPTGIKYVSQIAFSFNVPINADR